MNNKSNKNFSWSPINKTNVVLTNYTDPTITREFAIISCLVKSKRLNFKNIKTEMDAISTKPNFSCL